VPEAAASLSNSVIAKKRGDCDYEDATIIDDESKGHSVSQSWDIKRAEAMKSKSMVVPSNKEMPLVRESFGPVSSYVGPSSKGGGDDAYEADDQRSSSYHDPNDD